MSKRKIKVPQGADSIHSDMVISEESQSTKRRNQRPKTKDQNKKQKQTPSPSLTSTSPVFFLHLTSLRFSERSKNGQKAPEERHKKTSYFHFHSAHLAKVLGVKKTEKTTEERRRLNTPSCRGNRGGTPTRTQELLGTMEGIAQGGARGLTSWRGRDVGGGRRRDRDKNDLAASVGGGRATFGAVASTKMGRGRPVLPSK